MFIQFSTNVGTLYELQQKQELENNFPATEPKPAHRLDPPDGAACSSCWASRAWPNMAATAVGQPVTRDAAQHGGHSDRPAPDARRGAQGGGGARCTNVHGGVAATSELGPRCSGSGGKSTMGTRGVGRARPLRWGRFEEAGHRKEVAWQLGAMAVALRVVAWTEEAEAAVDLGLRRGARGEKELAGASAPLFAAARHRRRREERRWGPGAGGATWRKEGGGAVTPCSSGGCESVSRREGAGE
jgi:hypothetical protein